VLKRGTPVRSSDGIEIGTVRRAQETGREHMFDGIVIDTKTGKRFVDAPEVARIAERWVTLTISAAEAAELPPPGGGMRQRVDQTTTVRRAKRWGRGLRERWDRR
jgi:hypothetical protein